ncbi:MAG: hypothetical protein ABSC35_13635 [Candidatus Dormibacteria bacterium]|jgi:hypothetical protein
MGEATLEVTNGVCGAVSEEGEDVRFPLGYAEFGKERFQAQSRDMRRALQLDDQ